MRISRRAGLLLLALLASCRAPAPPVTSPSRSPSVERPPIQVTYRSVANVFEVMDNVTQWLPAKNDREYRDWWDAYASPTPEDESWFARYEEVRKRSYPAASPPSGVFPPEKPVDWVAHAFYEGETLDDAATRMLGHVPSDDVAWLRAFFTRYESRLVALRVLDESLAFSSMVEATNRALRDVRPYVDGVVRAYGQHERPRLTALYVWWPPGEHTTANNRGDVLLLKYHPKTDASEASSAADIVVHELVHVVSARRPVAERAALSKVFTAGCDPGERKPVFVLEEPLAVVQQKRFLRAKDPPHFDWARPWYGDPWVSTFAKLLYPVFDDHPVVDETFVRAAAKICAELRSLGPR